MRILFVTATRIGDAILSTGLLSHLMEAHPGARLTIACGAPAAPLFEAVPGLERLLVVRKRKMHMHWMSLWASCATRRWDVVVDLRGSGLSWFLLAGRRFVMRGRDDSVHRMVVLARTLGLSDPPAPRIWTSAEDDRRAAELIPDGRVVVSIGPTANWRAKQWRAARFAELAARLAGPDGLYPGASIAVSGAESEREQAQAVLDALPGERVIDLVGASLPLTHACFARSRLYVGNDSGLTHLAAASGTPTLALFGPTRDDNYAPWGPSADVVRTPESVDELVGRPGFDHRTSDTLMDGLEVDRVVAAARALSERFAAAAIR